MELFLERIVKRKKSGLDNLIVAGEIVACVVLGVAAFALIPSIGMFLAVGLGYGTWYLVGMRNVEFEYAITNGELDIDRIVSRRRRKRIFSAHGKEFELVAPIKSSYYANDMKEMKKKIDATAGKDAEGVWFIITNMGGERGIVLFQPTANMVDALWHANPRKVMRA